MFKILILFSFLISPTAHSKDQGLDSIAAEFDYAILLDGDNAGAMTVRVSELSNGGYKIFIDTKLELSGWWGEHSIRSNSVEQYTRSGSLLTADNRILDGEKSLWITMELSGAEMWVSAVEVKSAKEHEEDEFVGVMVDIGSMSIPDAFTTGSSLLLLSKRQVITSKIYANLKFKHS